MVKTKTNKSVEKQKLHIQKNNKRSKEIKMLGSSKILL